MKAENLSNEIRLLRGCINDLVSTLALPAMWKGSAPIQIVETLLDVLLGMLRLDFNYIQLNDLADGSPVEVIRISQGRSSRHSEEIKRAVKELIRGDPFTSLCSVPNPIGEGEIRVACFSLGLEKTGIMVAASSRADFPTETEVLLLRVAANQAAIALQGAQFTAERKQAEERLREQTEVVETINRIGQTLSAELDQQKLVQALTDAATELTGAAFGAYFYNVIDPDGGSYMLYTLSGVPRRAFAHFPMPRATDLFGPTFRGEGVLRIADVKKDPRYGKNSPYYGMPAGHLPVTSYLSVPVKSRSGEVLGGLFFGHPNVGVFTDRHERIIVGLAAQAAVALDNARLYELAQSERAEADAARAQEQALRAEAEQSNRLKDEFLATVSHELRTPLNSILGWTRLLRDGKLDPPSHNRALETIERNAKSQAQLIEDLLDVSRIISGNMRLDMQSVDLVPVIQTAINSVRPAAEAKTIELSMMLDPDAGPVSGDPTRLLQIVWNLLSNAIKFTPKLGRVQVQLARINSLIEITVSDTGVGINPDFLPFAFDRFRQADSKLTRAHPGLGLGLAIVRHLVELHGGSISAQSAGEGHGASFTIQLPLLVVRDAELRPPSVSETKHPIGWPDVPIECSTALDGLRVLVVEDESDSRQLMTTILESCKASVTAVACVADGLIALEELAPDILVSDIQMPGEDGYSFIRKVRAREAGENGRIPAAALTAHAGVVDRMRALAAGFDIHVPKPVEPAELVAVIASLASRTRKYRKSRPTLDSSETLGNPNGLSEPANK